jgi:protein-tyrosine-phosphatase
MNLLFVCHGNRYRSPFAEGLMRELCLKVSCKSAGVKLPIGNFGVAKPSRDAALRRGVVLTGRSQGTSVELLAWADTIYYMDGGNLRRLQDQFGPSEKYVCLARVLGESRIPDPAFLTGEPRDRVWQLIEDACRELKLAIE